MLLKPVTTLEFLGPLCFLSQSLK